MAKKNKKGNTFLLFFCYCSASSSPRERRLNLARRFNAGKSGKNPTSRQRRLNSIVADATWGNIAPHRGLKPTAKLKRRSRGEEAEK